MNRTEARNRWESMTELEQVESLRKMCLYVKKYAASRHQSWAAWIRTEDDLQTAGAEAWLEMEQRQLDSGAAFEKALYTACAVAIKREHRKNERAGRAVELDAERTEGEKGDSFFDWLQEKAQTVGEQKRLEYSDPYEIAAAAEIREQIAADDTDRKIISGLLEKKNLTEISEQLKISRQAVSKRLSKIRNRYTAAIA